MAAATSSEAEISFSWRDGGKAPFEGLGLGSVVDGNKAYFLSKEELQIHSFNSSTKTWSVILPPCPNGMGSLAIVKGLLTVVGGWPPFASKATDKLYSLTEKKGDNDIPSEWTEVNPPMHAPRHSATTATYQSYLIVAGGLLTLEISTTVDSVEVLNTDTLQWHMHMAAKLPDHGLFFSSGSGATICGETLYILGGKGKDDQNRSFSTSLPTLIEKSTKPSRKDKLFKSRQSKNESDPEESIWKEVPNTPMRNSTCATVRRQLVAVGGCDSSDHETKKVYKYNPLPRTKPGPLSWKSKVADQMLTARSSCNVAVLDTNELMVFGGSSDKVEIAKF